MTAQSNGIPIAPRPDQPVPVRPPDRPSRPKESERTTRRPTSFWDRSKLLFLFLGAFTVMVWAELSQNPIIPFVDALRVIVQSYGWLLILAALELVRQLHFLIAERSSGYYLLCREKVFGRYNRRLERISDWTRFRVGRVIKLILFLVVLDVLIAKIVHVPEPALFYAPALLVSALPMIFQLLFAFFFVIFQFVGLFWFLSRGGVDVYMPDDIETRFTDVKGQDAVLERVKENMIFLEDPESIEKRGGHVPGGVLLWGPPGTGKTLMAKAVAGETARPFVGVEPGAFIQMFMGVGILKVKSLYRKLRRLATRHGGVIVFFDEADALGSRGGGSSGGGWNAESFGSPWTTDPSCNGIAYAGAHSRSQLFTAALSSGLPQAGGSREGFFMGGMGGGGGMGTLQAILSEMDGLGKPRGFINRHVRRMLGMKPKPPPKYRILHIFATNMPQSLDEAMLRPGRIDRLYKVGYPHKEGRIATFEYYLARVQHQLSTEQIEKLAIITPYATGATIRDMVNEGLVIAIRDGRDAISWADIIRAKQLKEHGLPDDHEYIQRERHSIAVHEACHAVTAFRLRHHEVIDIATIERRGDVGGFVASIPPEDQFVDWRSERDTDIMTFLASLAGERLFYDGDNSAGVGGDMRGATSIAVLMEGYAAMGDSIASHGVTKFGVTRARSPMAFEDGTDRNFLETELGRRVEARLERLYEKTWALLEQNRSEVLAVAHALETHKTVTGDDITAIIEGRRGPLIDGRPYHDPAFIAQLEAYHRAALGAHRDHTGVESPLPQPELIGATVGEVSAEQRIRAGGAGSDGNGHGAPPRPDTV